MQKVILLIWLFTAVLSGSTLKTMKHYADAVSDWYGVPRTIVSAVIEVESSWKTNVVSHADCHGLMQVSEGAYEDYRRLNPSTPYTNFDMIKSDYRGNIAVGVWYLQRLYRFKKNWKCAITAYFWGQSHPQPTETYYRKVKSKIAYTNNNKKQKK